MCKYNILVSVFLWSIAHCSIAQVVVPADPADPSAELQIDSNDKAVLFPRLTTVQINAIVNPAHGLLVFNTTLNAFVYNIGTEAVPQWQELDKFIINTNAEIAAIPTPTSGDIRYNSDTKTIYFYNGLSKRWEEICEDPQCEAFLVSNTINSNVSCYGESDGSAEITVSAGGTAPFVYEWPDGNTSSTRSDLAAGTYTVTVTDDKSCAKTTDVTITQPADLSIAATATIDSCERSVGTVLLDASQGTPFAGNTYEYSADGTIWTANVETQLYENLSAASYTFYARDDNGCQKSVTASIVSTPSISVSFSAINNVATCGETDAFANVDVAGGSAFADGFDFSWDGLAPQRALSGYTKNLNSGVHHVVVIDSENCSDTNAIIINLPDITFTDDGTGVAIVSDGNEAYWSLRRCGDVSVADMACNCDGTIYYWNTSYDYFADEAGNILLPLSVSCTAVASSSMFGHPDNPAIDDKDGDGVIDYDYDNPVNNEIDYTVSNANNYQFDINGTDDVYDKNNLIVSPAIYPNIKVSKLFDYNSTCNGPGDCDAEYGSSVAYCPEPTNEAGDIVDLYSVNSEVSGNTIQQSMEGAQTICTESFGYGWRLPTIQEVRYNYDVASGSTDPKYDPAYYNNPNDDGYSNILLYTSSKVTSGSGDIYYFQAIIKVDEEVAPKEYNSGSFNWSNGYHVRCVFDTDLPLWKTNAECH